MNDFYADRRMTENIYHCSDGKFRWIYEYSMMKNPVILFTILKIFGIIGLIIFLFVVFVSLVSGNIANLFSGDFEDAKYGLLAILVFIGVIFLSYFIVAAQYGFKYCVIFEMDDYGIAHIQQAQQFEKARATAFLQMMLGAAQGNLSMYAGGFVRYDKQAEYTTFSQVHHVKVMRAFHTIKIDAPLSHNQIYADPNDFEFVFNFLRAHVPPNIAMGMR